MRLLILGGAGMVGIQVAREAVTGLAATEIVISALTRREVDEAVSVLETEASEKRWDVKFTSAPGDIFLPEALQGIGRDDLIRDRASFDAHRGPRFESRDLWPQPDVPGSRGSRRRGSPERVHRRSARESVAAETHSRNGRRLAPEVALREHQALHHHEHS